MEKVYYLITGEGRLTFEFDEAKSRANRVKHDIDFVEAQGLWLDVDRTESPARFEGEPRWLVTGLVGRRFWTAVITPRENRIRLISVRRAREDEARTYEEG